MDTGLIERVRELIHRSGLNQRQFAAHIGLEPDKLSKSLSGRRTFSSFELALVADVGGVSVDWILTGIASAAPSIAARANRDDAIDAESISAAARRFADAHNQLEILSPRRVEFPTPPPTRDRGFVQAGEVLATWAHAQLALGGHSVVGSQQDALLAAIEQSFGIDAAITELPPGLDGCAWQTETMRLLIAARTPYWSRQRFSIAHELGHLLAGDAQELIAEPVDTRAKDPTEKRANAFAASFLMPTGLLMQEGASGIDREVFVALVNRLLVSPVSLGWRLLNLRLIPEADRLAWSKSTAEQCALEANLTDHILAERRYSDSERLPPRLVAQHLHAYEAGRTSARPLASLLAVEPAQIIDLFGRW